MKNRKWIGTLVYAALSLVIAILWFAKFDNIAIGIIFTVVSVLMLIIAMLQIIGKID